MKLKLKHKVSKASKKKSSVTKNLKISKVEKPNLLTKLTIDINRDLHKRFKAWCAGEGFKMGTFLNKKIREAVEG